jgi:hypothetical protein
MEVLIVQLTVDRHPVLDQSARLVLRNSEAFSALPIHRIQQVWRGPLPVQGCFVAQVQDSAVFISEDWIASIHGRNLLVCLSAMCAIVNALGQEFETQVEIRLPYYPGAPGNELYRQLDREQAMRRFRAVGLWILTLVAGGIVGALLQWLLGGRL